MLEALSGAIHRANDRIADLVEADLSLDGMGTTVTGAMFDGSQIGLAHIGDSRAYLLRDGHLEQLTHDHSWVQSLVDEGKIDSVRRPCTRTDHCCSRCSTASPPTTQT